jgi:hypothetical protein
MYQRRLASTSETGGMGIEGTSAARTASETTGRLGPP